MPKPINPTIGSCPCSMRDCSHTAEVKKEKGKRKRLYLVCQAHGVINVGGKAFQDFILENATLHGPDGASPKPAPVPERADPLRTDIKIANEPREGIEQGPAPEPYPQGVELQQAKPKPAPGPEHKPAPARPAPEPKPTEKTKTSKRPGVPGLRWLTDGLSEL